MMVVVSVNLDRIFALMRSLLPVGAVQKIGHYLQQSTKATTARRHLKLGFDLAWYIYFFNFQLPTLLGCLLWYFCYKQRSFGSRYAVRHFETLMAGEIKDGCTRNPAQTTTTEWTAEVQSKTNVQTQARQVNKQTVESAGARCPSCKKQLKQQRQQCKRQRRLKKRLNTQPTNLARIWIHSVSLYCQKSPKQNMQDSFKIRQRNLKKIGRHILHALSNMQNDAISCCCFVNICKQRQEMNKEVNYNPSLHSRCTRCRWNLLNLTPWNRISGKIMNSQARRKLNKRRSPAVDKSRPRVLISGMKRNWNI